VTGCAPAIWWVRHGPTHANAMIGWTNLPADLTDLTALAGLSASLPADAPIVSSDLVRASATADAIAGTRNRWPPDPRLRELNLGIWDGKTANEVDSPLLRAFWDQPGDVSAPGGESWNDLVARVRGVRDDLLEYGEDIVVVAHMGVIMAAIQLATGIPPIEAFSHRIPPLSITVTFGDRVDRIAWLP